MVVITQVNNCDIAIIVVFVIIAIVVIIFSRRHTTLHLQLSLVHRNISDVSFVSALSLLLHLLCQADLRSQFLNLLRSHISFVSFDISSNFDISNLQHLLYSPNLISPSS
ncbi:hypothetical protein Csa_017542 [Cucumis sativus]|uniref:Uncharacterized protein n=1 Tax=Cucumis sativus TaxID=3659 RepID=A0A0A0LB51_CUCSA|nr:hypothetical protein Csa_017542 [Cucumis sativus]